MEDKMSLLKRLQAQRSDVLSKLNRIENKKSSVSAEVYDKVRKEYADKLKAIDEQLGSHIDVVTEEIQRLKEQESEISRRMKETKFKMEEVELRYSIGEYDESAFKKVKAEDDARMKQFDEELKRTRDSIQYYSSFIEGKEPQAAAPQPSTEPAKEETGLTIDEHILEEKLPEEEVALEELLSEEEALKPDVAAEGEQGQKVEQEKGVACPKCNHINTADSWYCEKCGAEILGASGSS
ncbi:MAG: zinc finger Ran-binding domain-containing protein [candidate division WOR-3 bacterium]|nr:zinc finger Ran-binding domain-containing protein [candidate division WOR-3 bacterium]